MGGKSPLEKLIFLLPRHFVRLPLLVCPDVANENTSMAAHQVPETVLLYLEQMHYHSWLVTFS